MNSFVSLHRPIHHFYPPLLSRSLDSHFLALDSSHTFYIYFNLNILFLMISSAVSKWIFSGGVRTLKGCELFINENPLTQTSLYHSLPSTEGVLFTCLPHWNMKQLCAVSSSNPSYIYIWLILTGRSKQHVTTIEPLMHSAFWFDFWQLNNFVSSYLWTFIEIRFIKCVCVCVCGESTTYCFYMLVVGAAFVWNFNRNNNEWVCGRHTT